MNFLDYIVSSYVGGVGLMILGVFFLIRADKDDKKTQVKNTIGNVKFRKAGIAFLLIGVTIIIAKFLGKLN